MVTPARRNVPAPYALADTGSSTATTNTLAASAAAATSRFTSGGAAATTSHAPPTSAGTKRRVCTVQPCAAASAESSAVSAGVTTVTSAPASASARAFAVATGPPPTSSTARPCSFKNRGNIDAPVVFMWPFHPPPVRPTVRPVDVMPDPPPGGPPSRPSRVAKSAVCFGLTRRTVNSDLASPRRVSSNGASNRRRASASSSGRTAANVSSVAGAASRSLIRNRNSLGENLRPAPLSDGSFCSSAAACSVRRNRSSRRRLGRDRAALAVVQQPRSAAGLVDEVVAVVPDQDDARTLGDVSVVGHVDGELGEDVVLDPSVEDGNERFERDGMGPARRRS